MKEGKKKKYPEKTSDDELQNDNQIQFARTHVILLQLHNRLKTILVGCLTQCGRTCLKSLNFVVYAALKKLSQTSLLWVSFQSQQWQCNSYFYLHKRNKVQLQDIDNCIKHIPNPRRRNATTSIQSMVGLKNGHIRKNLTQDDEPRRYSWGMQKKKSLLVA